MPSPSRVRDTGCRAAERRAVKRAISSTSAGPGRSIALNRIRAHRLRANASTHKLQASELFRLGFAHALTCRSAGCSDHAGARQAQKPRERDLKLPIGGTPGPLDAITDVAGVEVGHTTLISGSGKLVVGKGPVRTGVTVDSSARQGQPRSGLRRLVHAERQRRDDRHDLDPGERAARRTGGDHQHAQRRRRARRDHPVGGRRGKNALQPWWLPVVAETYDGGAERHQRLSREAGARARALDGAAGGLPQEGNVGGGTGMVCHGFKGGIGTASRKLPAAQGGYTVGVLVQCNYGSRRDLRIAGVPVGEEITDLRAASPTAIRYRRARVRRCDEPAARRRGRRRRSRDRSSSSSRPTRRSCRTS